MDREKLIDLGSWVGLQKAFAILAGSCSAARAQCLQQVRESHRLDDLGLNWEEFCKQYAGLSRAQADHLIRQYEHFGDAYFRLSEIARVSPKTFRQIAARVDGDTIEIDGQKLALIPENASKIRAALQSLRNQVRRPPRPPAEFAELQVRIDGLVGDLAKAIQALKPAPDSDAERSALRALALHAMNRFRALARQSDAGT